MVGVRIRGGLCSSVTSSAVLDKSHILLILSLSSLLDAFLQKPMPYVRALVCFVMVVVV